MFSVMHAISEQTSGLIDYDALIPITTGHQLCCFCSSFLRENDGRLTSLVGDRQKEEGASCCCDAAPDPLDIIKKDRDFVLNKWVAGESAGNVQNAFPVDDDKRNIAGESRADNEPLSFDDALNYLRNNMFSLSGMAFMDGETLDAERLKRCRVQVFTEDGRLVPFCAYNSIYRNPKGFGV
jgi:hypothetical protein